MSRSLVLEYDPIDQPAATDPLERLTWCALRIRVGDRFPSTIWDPSIRNTRKTLYLPAFPIAEWVARNWWALLNELCDSEKVPTTSFPPAQLSWIQRHCLRSADSALLLPALYLFHDGRNLKVEWQADRPGSMPNMPGEFTDAGEAELDARLTQESLGLFVTDTLERVRGVDDFRVQQLAALWKAIRSADAAEVDFCTVAGRLGLDPYNPEEISEELVKFLEENVCDAEDPLTRDLTEVAHPDMLLQRWQWVSGAVEHFGLGPVRGFFGQMKLKYPSTQQPPHEYGYQLAREVRSVAHVDLSARLSSVEVVASTVLRAPFQRKCHNHVPGQEIRTIVGRSRAGDVMAIGPLAGNPDSQRFLDARAVYHAIATAGKSPRLITTAHSWEQRASRAFAAELLAPQAALFDRVATSEVSTEVIVQLSREFEVSQMVIERQLQNVGISLAYE